ncbi:uncharacterized protein [Haliotis cracherodii]|uniref:uncharacterized protein isoform X1 n=1 Tax=Haliotis cracherodii TaxID=6455 RepID=UPI0039EB29DA
MTATVLLLTSVLGVTLAVTPHILTPQAKQGPEAALVIVPGAYVKGEQYIPLGQEIQKSSPLKLWVVVLAEFIADLPNPLQLSGAVTDAIAQLRKKGMTSDNVFLAGHSLGGVFVGNHGKSHAKQLKGILLLASYITKGNPLSQYPLPVLTISGDLDGNTRITRIADTFQELQSDVAKDANAMYRTPVVIMSGINHAQFASGTMPSGVVKEDLAAEVTESSAHKVIAQHCNNFLVATLQQPQTDVSKAKVALKQAYAATSRIMKPLLDLKTLDVNDQKVSGWTIRAQQLLLGDIAKTLKITNKEDGEAQFVLAKAQTGTNNVVTVTHVGLPFNPMDVSTNKASPDQLEAKMKTREAVVKSLSGVKAGSAPSITCKDINEAAFQLALNSSSSVARTRYQKRAVRRMVFKDDVKIGTGIQWVGWKLDLKETATELEVTSASLVTSLNTFISSFGGMYYCKLLAPYRAMEWIYVDSLRAVSAGKSPSLVG